MQATRVWTQCSDELDKQCIGLAWRETYNTRGLPASPVTPTPETMITAPPSEYPFQQIVVDLSQLECHMYLVNADRLTGLLEAAQFPSGTSSNKIIANQLYPLGGTAAAVHRWPSSKK